MSGLRRSWRILLALVTTALAGATATSAAALPDGRAYELVSPPNKGGYEVAFQAAGLAAAQASLDGEILSYASFGVFPGTGAQGGSANNTYLSSRPGSGREQWLTVATTPPLSDPDQVPSLSHGGIRESSDDLSGAVMQIEGTLPGDPPAPPDREPLYLRHSGSAGFELLTPGLAPFSPPWSGEDFRDAHVSSGDLRHVVWQDNNPNLASDPITSGRRVYESFVNASGEREMRLVSILPDGSPTAAGLGGSSDSNVGRGPNAMSTDGRRIFFTVGVTVGAGELYVRENGNTTTFIATGDFSGATPDGSRVFVTDAAGLLRRHDLDAGAEITVADGVPTNGAVLGFSDDGSRIYFVSSSDLTGGAPAGPKIYLWEEGTGGGTYTFVAPVDNSDLTGDAFNRFGNTQPTFKERMSRVTPDGAFALFRSSVQVTAFDNAGTVQYYLYQAGGGVECVSCPPGAPTGAATLVWDGTPSSSGPTADEQQQNLTSDGRRVFFQSRDALVPEDSNGRLDVYQYDSRTDQVALISTGKSSSDSIFADASPDGEDVFFTTRERLVGWDQDNAYDLYDARVGGGLPEPPTPPVACSGDECQGQPPGRPALVAPATSLLHGPGDFVPRARAAFRLVRPSKAQLSRLATTGRLTLPVRVNRAGRVSLAARAKIGKRTRTVGRESKRAPRAGTVKLALKLSKAARRQLARTGRMKLSLSVRFAGVREAKRLGLNLRRSASASRRASANANRKAGWAR
jgi:Tol biopolymer transport system component